MISDFKLIRRIHQEEKKWRADWAATGGEYIRGVLFGLKLARDIIMEVAIEVHSVHLRWRMRMGPWKAPEMFRAIVTAQRLLRQGSKTAAMKVLAKVIREEAPTCKT